MAGCTQHARLCILMLNAVRSAVWCHIMLGCYLQPAEALRACQLICHACGAVQLCVARAHCVGMGHL